MEANLLFNVFGARDAHLITPLTFFLQLMLDTWNESIFSNIKSRLQDSAMKLVHAERQGEAFDSQLVIGVRESYGKTDGHEHVGQTHREEPITVDV